MMLPAYSMDALPAAYEVQFDQTASLSAAGRDRPRNPQLIAGHGSEAARYVVAPTSSSELMSSDENVAKPESSFSAGPVQASPTAVVSSRREILARIAFGCGWLFLGIAVICLLRPLSIVSTTARRRLNSLAVARVHSSRHPIA